MFGFSLINKDSVRFVFCFCFFFYHTLHSFGVPFCSQSNKVDSEVLRSLNEVGTLLGALIVECLSGRVCWTFSEAPMVCNNVA